MALQVVLWNGIKQRKIFVKALDSIRVNAHKSQCTYEAGRETYELMNVTKIKQRYTYICQNYISACPGFGYSAASQQCPLPSQFLRNKG